MSKAILPPTKVMWFGLPLVIGTVILHAYQLVVELQIKADAPPIEADLFPARLQAILLLSLLLAAAGLAINRRWGIVTSSLGLVGVLLGYTYWFYDSHRLLRFLAQSPFYQQHPEFMPPTLLGLIGARWWDIVQLILFVTLLIWEVMTLVKMSGNQIKRRSI